MIPAAPDTTFVCAVIVTYNSAASAPRSLAALAGQVGKVVIVDNSTDETARSDLQKIAAQHSAVYLANPDNNLGRAQNIGIDWAKINDFTFVLLLDDDSIAQSGMVETLLKAYQTHPRRESIGIIAPYIKDENVGDEPFYYQKNALGLFQRSRFSPSVSQLEDVQYVCAAGSLIPLSVVKKVGGMNEEFFIYFIDTEFCLRLIQNGYSILAVRDAVLLHQIGKRSEETVLGLKMTTTNHSALSRYYMARNRLQMWRKFALKEPSYIAFDALRSLYEIARIGLFESDKISKFKAILQGYQDSMRGVSGKQGDSSAG